MVKIKFKIIKNIVNSKKRIRGIKSNKNCEKQKNSLEEKINNLDSSKIIELRIIKFKPEDRIFIPSLYKDNPFIDHEKYEASLKRADKITKERLLK